MAEHLSNHHRDTLAEIFDHQRGGNVEWRKVRSLLEAVGTVDVRHNGKLAIAVGPGSIVLEEPRDKDVDRQTLVDLRRILGEAGYGPDSGAATDEERDRDPATPAGGS